MELGNAWFLQVPAAGAQASRAVAPPVRGFGLLETAPQGPELPLIGNRFRELREDDASVSPSVACEVTVSRRMT